MPFLLPEDFPSADTASFYVAMAVVHWASCNNVQVESIDEDAMEGMDVYLEGVQGRRIWVCLLNSGLYSIVTSGDGKHTGHEFSLGKLSDLLPWLQEGKSL